MPAGEAVGLGLPPGIQVTADEHDRAVRIGEGLRELTAAKTAGRATGDHAPGYGPARRGVSVSALADLAGLARRLPVVPATDGQLAAP